MLGRWQEHRKRLRLRRHKVKRLQEAFDRYGEASLRFAIVDWVGPCLGKELAEREVLAMARVVEKYGRDALLNASIDADPRSFLPPTQRAAAAAGERQAS